MGKYYYNKKVLVTGGTGLIGIPLVKKLKAAGAQVRIVSLDAGFPPDKEIEFIRGDLCDKEFCSKAVRGMRAVFHLAGIKGGIGVAQSKAASFLIKNILMNIQIMEASRLAGIERFLYASSICIYPPARVFEEKNAWSGLPHPSDRFGGMAKLVGEMQIEAYKQQYSLADFLIARPTNTYGPHDNFNAASGLIIPALISRIFDGERPLKVWGDGSAVRDFIFSDDVADFLMLLMERNIPEPLNVGSGLPVTIKSVVETIVKHAELSTGRKIAVKWDLGKPAGEQYRVTSIEKARNTLGWEPRIDLETGISRTIEWYSKNKTKLLKRYSILSTD
jgi:GDP-L-fucose synthase